MMVSEVPASECQYAVLAIRRSQPHRCPRDRRHLALARAALRPTAAALVVARSGGGRLRVRPAELGAVAPHTMENDRKLAGHGDSCLLVADLPGQPGAP